MKTLTNHRSLIREAWERTAKFILPEESVSLKVIFDNVRNYIVCSAVIAAVVAFSGSSSEVWPWSLRVVAFFLLGANTLQSWLIIQHLTKRIGSFQRDVRPNWGRFQRRLMRTVLVLFLLPIIVAAYEVFPALILYALNGGK